MGEGVVKPTGNWALDWMANMIYGCAATEPTSYQHSPVLVCGGVLVSYNPAYTTNLGFLGYLAWICEAWWCYHYCLDDIPALPHTTTTYTGSGGMLVPHAAHHLWPLIVSCYCMYVDWSLTTLILCLPVIFSHSCCASVQSQSHSVTPFSFTKLFMQQ